MKKVYLVFLFMLLGINTARADFNDGVVAYLMGDYEKAYNTMVSLAKIYTEGKGVPKDYEFAFLWYSTGAAHNHALSKKAVENAKARLSGSELKEAQKLLTEFIEKYGPQPEEPAKTTQLPDEKVQ